MKPKIFYLALIVALALTACGGAATPAPSMVEAPAFAAATAAPAAGEGGAGLAANAPAGGERLVIKNANLSVVVDNPEATVDAVTQMVESMDGFVVSVNTYKTTYGPEATSATQANMTIRVPGEKLNEALKQIKAMAVEVRSENISGQDVTAEYTDLKSRLKNLEAAEKQLQSIMEEATKTEDVLAVYNQLVYTREQIEVIKGQMKYYEEASAMSAVTLDIIPNVATQPIQIGGWHPEGTAKESIEALVRLLQGLTDFLIRFTIVCGPFLIAIGVPAFVIGRIVVRRMRKTGGKTEQAGTEKK
ncbi:MAG TPA: DUF4349 domain-containing protein [Anaerolineales bacterium]|nr:DUF4349 domain-containing protein [Anaerolineales bacterium]